MMDEANPVGDGHRDFARAVVALARAHGVSTLSVTFTRASSSLWKREQWDPARVTATWTEGRHGDGALITLRAESALTINEKETPE